MSVAEALALATPAIVSKGAPWSGLAERRAGWWIDIGLEPLIACLEESLAKPAREVAEMGLRGRQWMETEYSWTRIGQQMAETYRWVMGAGSRPAFGVLPGRPALNGS